MLKLPAIFKNGMILQQTAGTEKTRENEIRIEDILVGEVWLAGGQSNMELELQNSADGEQVVQAAAYEQIRFYNVPKCAVAYYFAVSLYEKLQIPIGVIDCYWGGTSATCWMSEEMLATIPEVQTYKKSWEDVYASKSDETYERELRAYQEDYNAWNERVEKLRRQQPDITWEMLNEQAGVCPWPQPMGRKSPFRPCGLYETMIRRIVPYGIRGFLYYQGEEDWDKFEYYHKLNSGVIRQWRKDFGQEAQLPFYLVQLPMYRAKGEADDKNWCILREQQARTVRENPETGMAVILDCGEFDNIHPVDKKTPGTRLALQVLGKVYEQNVACDTMEAAKIEWMPDAVRVLVRNTYGGVCYRQTDAQTLTALKENLQCMAVDAPEDAIRGFEISYDGKTYEPAQVKVREDELLVKGNQTGTPCAVRYGWTNYGVANVYNAAGLPLAPFRKEREDGLETEL